MKISDTDEPTFSLAMLEKISSILVKLYIKRGSIEADDYNDFCQAIKAKYLQNKDKIESKFKGDSQAQTYMSAVLNNMLLEELRAYSNRLKKSAEFEKAALKEGEADTAISPENRTVIENEKKHLQRVMLTLGKNKAKVLMCSKMVFKIKVADKDFTDYLAGRPSNGAENYLSVSESDQNQDIYQKLCTLTNLVEGKDNKPDAIRLWLSKQMDHIISRLNSNGYSKYTVETLGILMEDTFY